VDEESCMINPETESELIPRNKKVNHKKADVETRKQVSIKPPPKKRETKAKAK
jgi:hypothetical protein